MSAAAKNNAIRRFTASFPCPVCKGGDDTNRGAGERCFGFLSGDGEYAHCTREEHAGECRYEANAKTWSHRLKGPCRCGVEHGPAVHQPAAKKPRGKFVAAYDYKNASGDLVHQTVRYASPKSFSQRRPDPAGRDGWKWSLKGVTTVLYRLPELLAADPEEWVIVVEGEKDADRGAKFGLVTTTNPMGAGKWRPHYADCLRGRRVAIVPDNHQLGMDHAQSVAESLVGRAREVRVVELRDVPEKGDLSDYLDRGHSVADFKRLVEEATVWTPVAKIFRPEDDPPRKADQSPANVFSNWEDAGVDDKGHRLKRGLLNPEIDELRQKAVGDWPKRVNGRLFRATSEYEVHYLDSDTRLFAMIDGAGVKVDWTKGASMITQARYYEHLRMSLNVESFESVEQYPHWPKRERTYYAHPEIPLYNGQSYLDVFLSHFKPATPEDAVLLKAFFLTLFWGGPPGQRPAFVFEGPENDPEQGRGVGKTTAVEIMALGFVGGDIRMTSTQTFENFKKRLFSVEGLGRRVVLLDNLKSDRLSNPDLEESITTEVLSGTALYVGEGRRPNTFTWAITVNGASLSKDMASRSWMIRLARADYSDEWKAAVKEFIDKYRWQIISEVGHILTSNPAKASRAGHRWAVWEKEVLCRATDADTVERCRELAQSRREEMDDDDETMNQFRDVFVRRLKSLHFDPETCCVHIKSAIAAEWVISAGVDKRINSQTASTRILKRIGIPELVEKKHDDNRGFLWTGPRCSPEKRVNPSTVGDVDFTESEQPRDPFNVRATRRSNAY